MTTKTEAQRLLRIQHQIEEERVAARAIVAHLRSTIHERWDSEVPSHWRTAGVVEELTRTARELLEKDPRAAQALAQYAVVVVTSIPERLYPAPILVVREAEAWNELANAHRYLSQYDAALRALDAAERRLHGIPSVGWHRSNVGFARAVVFSDMNRIADAEALVTESLRGFEEYKDANRSAHAVLLQGILRHRSNRFAEAVESYRRAVELFGRTSDVGGLGSALNNLGCAYAELGETSSAVTALHDALTIFADLGFKGESARTRCVLASILLRTSALKPARELLSAARETFAGMGMVEEAGLAGLVLVEVLLAQEDTLQARLLTERVLAEFRSANLGDRALLAMSYLHDMISGPRARDAVRHVRQYIKDLKNQPLQAFAPLPE